MPLCFCLSHGCSSAGGMDPIFHKPRGKNIDSCTLKAHSLADRQTTFCAAQQNTKAVIDTQIKEITTYLSASVLADEVSRLSEQNPGSFLWSRHEDSEDCLLQNKPIATPKWPHPQLPTPLLASHNSYPGIHPTSLHSPPHQAGSRHLQEDEILASLADIEVEVDALCHKALNGNKVWNCIGTDMQVFT